MDARELASTGLVRCDRLCELTGFAEVTRVVAVRMAERCRQLTTRMHKELLQVGELFATVSGRTSFGRFAAVQPRTVHGQPPG